MKNFNAVSLKGIVRKGRKSGLCRASRPAPSMVIQGSSMDLNRNLDIMAQKDLRGFFDDVAAKVAGFKSTVEAKVSSYAGLFAPSISREQQTAMAKGAVAQKLSLKSVAQAGAQFVAQQAPALAKAKVAATTQKGFIQKGVEAFDNVFSGGATWVSNAANVLQATTQPLASVYGTAQKIADAFGKHLPSVGENLVKGLDDKISTLKGNTFTANSYLAQVVKPALAGNTPEGNSLAQSLTKAINDFQNAASVALTKLAIAKVAADSAQNDLMHGVVQSQALAAYALQANPAEQAFNEARLQFQAVEELASKTRSARDVQTTTVVERGLQTMRDFGGAVGQTVQEAGGIVLDTAKDVGAGVTSTGGMMKFLPYILIGGAALYVVTIARSTGQAMGAAAPRSK